VLPGAAVFPEGIAYDGRTGTIYVTSTTDGTVYRGDVRDGTLSPFLAGGADGRTTAIGIAVDPLRQRVFVAGGATGRIFVYDARTGALLANLTGGASPTFVNDVVVAQDGTAYATDSQSPVLYRVVEDGAGGFRLERWLDLTGTAITYQPGFNLNGIEITPDGRYLFVVQSNTGQLFRIDTRTRAVAAVDLGGTSLPAGDGLLLRGTTLYVVQNALGTIAEVRLGGFGPGAPRGTVVGRITDPSFRFPTTVEEARGRLLVVNSQFDRRGPGRTPETPFTVSVVQPHGAAGR
jgi:Cu-Zn family superoxide dismutase